MKKYIVSPFFSETCNVECVMNQISSGGSQGSVDAEVKKRGAEVLTDEEMDEEAIMQLIVDRESGNTSDLW